MSYRYFTLILIFLLIPFVSAQDDSPEIEVIPVPYLIPNISLSPDGTTLVAYEDGSPIVDTTVPELLPIRLINIENGAERANLLEGIDYTQSSAITPDGSKLATVEFNGDIFIWDLQFGEHIKTLNGLPSQAHLAFVDNTHLATTSSSPGVSTIVIWDIEAEAITSIVKEDVGTYYDFRTEIVPIIQSKSASAMILSPDGNNLILALFNNDIVIVDIETGERHLIRDSGEDNPLLGIRELIPSQHNNALYYLVQTDKTVYQLDLETGEETVLVNIDERRLLAFAVDEAQDRLMWLAENAGTTSLYIDRFSNRGNPTKIALGGYLPEEVRILGSSIRIILTADGNTAILGGFVNADSPDNALIKVTFTD